METKKVQSRDGRVDQCAGLESLSLLVGGVGSNPTPGALLYKAVCCVFCGNILIRCWGMLVHYEGWCAFFRWEGFMFSIL